MNVKRCRTYIQVASPDISDPARIFHQRNLKAKGNNNNKRHDSFIIRTSQCSCPELKHLVCSFCRLRALLHLPTFLLSGICRERLPLLKSFSDVCDTYCPCKHELGPRVCCYPEDYLQADTRTHCPPTSLSTTSHTIPKALPFLQAHCRMAG